VLGSEYACVVSQRPIQFLSDEELLLLSGPASNCYADVNQLHLVVLSLQGRVIARKVWPSTDPGLVISLKRILVADRDHLLILDDRLETVQSLPLPKHRALPVLSLAEGELSVATDGGSLTCHGTPLECLEAKAGVPTAEGIQVIYRFADGQTLERKGDSLIETVAGETSKQIANLGWVSPSCGKYKFCQMYEAGTGYRVAASKERRVLVMSNGSRFPITDAAGLFPYFRIQVFDLDTSSKLYREEDVIGTGHRSAAISHGGHLLATFDGRAVVLHRLK
jgi:hypothetical protein